MTPVNKPKRIHHAIPKHYLKGFVEYAGSSYVWEYQKDKPFNRLSSLTTVQNPFRKSIRKAGAFEDLYAVKDSAVVDFETYENQIEALEQPAVPIFEKIRRYLKHNNLTQTEKLTFSRYILLMLKRVPSEQKRHNELVWPVALNEVEEQTSKLLDDYANSLDLGDLSQLARYEQKKDEASQIIDQFRKAIPDEVRLQAMIRQSELDFPVILSNMTWQFWIAPDKEEFFTSDDPVFYFRELGINKNASELTFPISKKVCLVASWRDIPEGYFPANVPQVETINERTAQRADRYLYAASVSKDIYDYTLRNDENTTSLKLLFSPYFLYKNIPRL
jgi:hypothetical protein